MAVTVIASEKRCGCCRETKPVEAFARDRSRDDGRHPWCKACKNSRAAGYYQRWTPEQRELHRSRVLRTRYGMTLEELVALYAAQEGKCLMVVVHVVARLVADPADRAAAVQLRPREGAAVDYLRRGR